MHFICACTYSHLLATQKPFFITKDELNKVKMQSHCTIDDYYSGDLNTSLFRGGSRHTTSLNKFVEDECLYFCYNHDVSTVEFTFCSSTGTQTLIDHFILTDNLSQSITIYETIDIVDNISDHLPVLLELGGLAPLSIENADNGVNVTAGTRNKPLWSVASDVDIININSCLIIT